MTTSTGGLLRLPRFLRNLLSAIKSEQEFRMADAPSLFYPEVRLSDIVTATVIAISIFSFRVTLERVVFPRVFARFTKRSRSKLSENLFYSVYYSASFLYFALVVLPQAHWSANLLSNSTNVVRSLIHPFPPPMNDAEHFFYSQSMGFYASAITFLILFDGRRSDFAELILHHAVTIGLVGMSYAYGYVRSGIIIIALHDVGDIFLYSAKFIHYLGFAGVDTAMFAVFTGVFYITRLVMFSRMVHTIFIETFQVVVAEPSFNRWMMFYDTYLVHYVFFVVCLSTLLFLHCFWMALILKMIYREVVLGKKVTDEGDIRSDSEDEDEPDPKDDEDNFLDDKDDIQKKRSDRHPLLQKKL